MLPCIQGTCVSHSVIGAINFENNIKNYNFNIRTLAFCVFFVIFGLINSPFALELKSYVHHFLQILNKRKI